MSDNDPITFEEWSAGQQPLGEGWETARLAIRASTGQIMAAPAFGWEKDGFGIYECNAMTSLGPLRVSALTHCATGGRIATFDNSESAAQAVELVADLFEWDRFTVAIAKLKKWRRNFENIHAVWSHYGFWIAPARLPGNEPIWTKAPGPTIQ